MNYTLHKYVEECIFPRETPVERPASKTILLVEDEAIIAMAEKMTLERAGYIVMVAGTGEKALEILSNGGGKGHSVDLVLMDIDLGPGMRGTEAASRILAERDLPVMFLSSHTEREVVEETEGITSYGYVVKNSEATVLLASIRMAFRLFETRRIVGDTFTHSINGLCVHRIIRDESGRLLDCEYLQVNSAFEQQTGLSARAITGKTIRDLYPGSAGDQVIHLYEEILAGRADSRQEIYFEPTQFWFELSVFRTREDEFTVVTHNITERKESERRLQDLFENMNEAFAVHEIIRDETGRAIDYRFLEVNRAFATRIAMAPEDILGRTALELFPGTEHTWIEDFGRVAATGEPEQITEYSRELDRHFETRLYRSGVGCCAGIFMDVTARVRAEEKTARHRQELNEINRIGTLANRELDLDRVLAFILEQTTRALNAQVGMIFLHDPERDTLSWGASLGLSREFVREFDQTPIRMGEGLTGRIARTREPVFIPRDSSRDPRIARTLILDEDLNSFIGVPILAGDRMVGVMNVLTKPPEELAPEDVPFCTAIGVQAGWAIVNARLQTDAAESDSRFRTISDNAVYGNAVADLEGNLVYVNRFFARIHGYEPEELLGHNIAVFHTPEQMAGVKRKLSLLLENGSFAPVETWHVRRDGTEFPMLMSGVLIRDEQNQPRYLAASAVDMTEIKEAEHLTEEAVRRLSTIMSSVPVGIILFDQDARVIEDNPAARRIFRLETGTPTGIIADDYPHASPDAPFSGMALCGEYIRCRHCAGTGSECGETPHCRDCTINDAIRQVLQGGAAVEEQDQEVIQAAGTSLWIRFVVVPLALQDTRCALLVAQDISARKIAEQEIARQLAEKELLLREIHHRVRNNVAAIESLLQQQADSEAGGAARDALREAAARVSSVSELYRKLLLNEDYRHVSGKEYLEDLIQSILRVFPESGRLTVRNEIADFPLDTRTAAALGIILNELMTNAFKYAFTGRAGGTLSISLVREEDTAILSVEDDGKGLPGDFNNETRASESAVPVQSSGIGLTLVRMLSEQLRGICSRETNGGTKTEVRFPL